MGSMSFTAVSKNVKVGKIPVSMSSKETCPDACSFKNSGCYAKYGNVSIHWNRLSSGKNKSSLSYDEFLDKIQSLPLGSLWRHNVAGDLAGNGDDIDVSALQKLVNANRGKCGFTYTHKPLTAANAKAIADANKNGFVVNVSTDTPTQADAAMMLGIAPVVTVLPINAPKVSYTPGGNRIVKCPADGEKITCLSCSMCARQKRDFIIGFEAHGTGKKHVDIIAKSI